MMNPFFYESLQKRDPDLMKMIEAEERRQQHHVELIASENYVSHAVVEAQGSILTNKYAEGYPGRRYYGGCAHVDDVETLAIERAKTLFGAAYANVQPHSGSQANQAVFLALLEPHDKIMGLSLDAGGHLTHGSKVNISGKWFDIIPYGLSQETALIDYDRLRSLAKEHRPKLIIAGGSAYPRAINFKIFREVADEIGAHLMVDMAHFAGLVAAGVHENPLPHAHVVTTTTHKTLRGPRGGMILTNHEEIAKKINSAVFPGLQGGPLMHVIAAKAVCFGEALDPSFKIYANDILKNAQALGQRLMHHGFHLISGGTDTHLQLVDLRPKHVTGQALEKALETANITTNKNAIPGDPLGPKITSGIRLGSPAMTTRGFKEKEFEQIADFIAEVAEALVKSEDHTFKTVQKIAKDIKTLLEQFPLYEGRAF